MSTNDDDLIQGAFGFDDQDAEELQRALEAKKKQKEERILKGSDDRVEKADELTKEEIERIANLSLEEREARWGFSHDELKAATKVVSVLFTNPHLFVGDPALAETRLYTMVSRDRATKRGGREVMKKMLAQEQARKRQARKAHDMAALQKTKMKQERDAALNALLIAGPPEDQNDDNNNDDDDDEEENNNNNEDDEEAENEQQQQRKGKGYKIILTQFTNTGEEEEEQNGNDVDNENYDNANNTTKKPTATLKKPKSCQICHTKFVQLHHFYYSLCPPCAELNFAKRNQKRDLRGRNVLLTGCRIKIGYEMALSLLRSGANLIGTTRFIHDCLNRLMQEKDYDEWKDRVHLFALDMRDLWMVEQFCEFIKKKFKSLFAIVNNAAQTIARTVSYTERVRFFESDPVPLVRQTLMANQDTVEWMSFFAENCSLKIGYPLQLEHRPLQTGPNTIQDSKSNQEQQQKEEQKQNSTTVSKVNNNNNNDDYQRPIYDRYDTAAEASDMRAKNSWTAKLAEVEGSEAAECMAINALAPLIINARLRCVLEAAVEEEVEQEVEEENETGGEKIKKMKKVLVQRFPKPYPLGSDPEEKRFIINVSAMEGMFYRKKSVTHPHTNMAKAALNMMTRTSGEDYAESGIFINSCDTGWVTDESIDSKRQKQWTGDLPLLPIDEADGAMRCLDLIYTNSSEHSKFWKDYKQIPW
jgi:NAD(P)-dependent dehydrogenase (short-subunit alcohol dehydrogenase family)